MIALVLSSIVAGLVLLCLGVVIGVFLVTGVAGMKSLEDAE